MRSFCSCSNMCGFVLLTVCACLLRFPSHAETNYNEIPPTLRMGVASSAYQVEGGWNEDGKGENIWDRLTHTQPERIEDKTNGDVACDSYHKINETIAVIKDLGFDYYRFSLSWSRILPEGFSYKTNPAGVEYYNKLIDALIANHIKPMVTLYHWDLPQPLQELGGFANADIVLWLKEYARVAFKLFGDRVKDWVSINEPKQICNFGYEVGTFAPAITLPGIGGYLCTHNLLKAHAHMYHLYDKVFKPHQKGRVGIVIEGSWSEPASNSTVDIEAAERRRQFDFGMYAHPIFHKNGDYPEVVKQAVAKRSKLEGFTQSRLPEFTHEEIRYIRGTYDFFGLNHYTTAYTKNIKEEPIGTPSQIKDEHVDYYFNDNWLTGRHGYFRLVPWGLIKTLNYIKNNYNNPVILITENGFPDGNGLQDTYRVRFFNESIQAVLQAIYKDKVRVEGYTAWSLLDSFEWLSGYTINFGLYHVDFTDPKRTLTPKTSAQFFKNVLLNRKL